MKKFKKTLIIILVVIALLIISNLLFRFYYQFQFNRRVGELSAQGFPVSLEDLEKDYVLSEGAVNAADVYIEAFSHYRDPNEAIGEYLPITGTYIWSEDKPPFPPEVMDALETHLEYNQQTLELLDEAVEIERCLWPRTLNDFYFFNDYFSEIRKSAQLLCERNLFLAQQGQADEIVRSFGTLTVLSESLLEQPVLIDYLVSMAIKGLAAGNLEHVLNQVEFIESQLKQLQIQFDEMCNPNELYQTLVNERCVIIVAYRLPLNKRYEYTTAWPIIHKLPAMTKVMYFLSGVNQKDKLLTLEFFNKFMNMSQQPPHEWPAYLEKINQEVDTYSDFHLHLNDLLSFVRIGKINLRVIGNLQSAQTALAVERYRLAHGSLPESLEDLVPQFLEAVPLDPFDGQPLRYVHRDNGYTVYTIGEDCIDNGGLSREQMAEKTGEENPKEYDWPFTVKR